VRTSKSYKGVNGEITDIIHVRFEVFTAVAMKNNTKCISSQRASVASFI
jgi:hypothetical protein